MKKLVSITLLLLASSSVAYANSSNTNGFDASNRAEFSGYQSYSQNNYSNGDNYHINGVKCPVPTMYFGGNASHADYTGHDPQQVGIALGVQIPLFTGRCDDAANAELRMMEWRLQDAQLATKNALEQAAENHKREKIRLCVGLMEKGFELPDNYCDGVTKARSNPDVISAIYGNK